MPSRPIHPFPARMASEIALSQCLKIPAKGTVLDPMAGSGTVLRAAADAGLRGIGFDLDPLAVLMARVWTTPVDHEELREVAANLIRKVEGSAFPSTPRWIDEDSETSKFVDYWFAKPQQLDLRSLSVALAAQNGPIGDALRVALSRLIITKDHGASLARDVSHSRPHRVRTENDFDVLTAFRHSVDWLANRIRSEPCGGGVYVALGDARAMSELGDACVEAVITSPPYLNALDYMRAHKLSLVWLGYQINELRKIRSEAIGAERAPDANAQIEAIRLMVPALGEIDSLPSRTKRMIDRFLIDLLAVLREVRRVLRTGGRATFVVGNSCLQSIFINNAGAVVAAADVVGLKLVDRHEREIPPARRYLPPPGVSTASGVGNRMRSEVVLSFIT